MKLGLIACAALALMGCAAQDDSECDVPALATFDVTFIGSDCPPLDNRSVTFANGAQRMLDDKAWQGVDHDGCGVSASATAQGWHGTYSIRFDHDWSLGNGVYVLYGCTYQLELVRQ